MGTLRTFFKPGDRIRGIVINSHASGKPKTIIGKLYKLIPNYANETVRVWVTDPRTLKITEVYVDTIERMYESRALTFEQFINS